MRCRLRIRRASDRLVVISFHFSLKEQVFLGYFRLPDEGGEARFSCLLEQQQWAGEMPLCQGTGSLKSQGQDFAEWIILYVLH